jgi:hypothetical protein
MSVTTCDSTATQATTAPTAVRQYLPFSIFVVCLDLYLLPIMRLVFVGSDQGTLVAGAARVARGQVFARDFFEVVGPGTFYWLGGFFKLFGVTYTAVSLCLFVTSLGTFLSIYFLSNRVCRQRKLLPCILMIGLYFGAAWPGVSHHTDSNFFGLVSLVCLVKWLDMRKASLLLATGVLAGVTMSIHWPKGLSLITAILLWLLIERRRSFISFAVISQVLAGFCAVIAVVLGYFWSWGALRDLIYANFIWPSTHYGTVNACPYAQGLITNYWNVWTAGKETFSWFNGFAAILIMPFLLVAALPVILLIAGVLQKWKTMKPEVLLYWLCGWALWLSEFHRRDIYHLVLGAPLLLILCVYLLGERREKVAKVALQALTVSACCLCAFNWILVALATHRVTTRVGSVNMFATDPAITFLQEHSTPGEEVFAYPYCPIYYFLSDTTNPTPYSILVYNYNTPSQFQDVVRILEQRRPKYVVWNTTYDRDVARVFPAAVRIRPDQLIVEPYLKSHYKLIKEEDRIRIMERMSEDHAD